MAGLKAVVARIESVHASSDASADSDVIIGLEGGQRVRLDRRDRRSPGLAQVLDGLRRQQQPVYLLIDPATSTITKVLIPHVARVNAVRRLEADTLSVELENSHGRHVLRRSQTHFAALERQLSEAVRSRQVLVVTEDDAHNIIDIRPLDHRS